MNQFVFGTATASYQIEGAVSEGGRTPSIWDTFCNQKGTIDNGDDGSVACDHYHRYKEDITLMSELGVESYRFSISWSRIFPRHGEYNQEGMDFYKSVLAELEAKGISAAVTLYHWDLPQWAQDLGGWENRKCVDWFMEYSEKVFEELSGKVESWITLNEPWCSSFLSNFLGEHAPGKTDLEAALRVAHHLLLAHGKAVRLFREKKYPGKIGITLNLSPVQAASDSFADKLAMTINDAFANRWFLEPLFHADYPADLAALCAARCATDFAFIKPGDLKTIAVQMDFLGINFYTHNFVKYHSAAALLNAPAYTGIDKTDMGWDVVPETLKDLIAEVRDYTKLPVFITENGCAYPDVVTPDGKVNDDKRCDFLLKHLQAIETINESGGNIAGYYYWSFMDNFEWARGYSKRFGLVYLDYKTQKRIPKDSFYVYKKYIAEHK